jgi:C-terminal processing protease CtpA/Prc
MNWIKLTRFDSQAIYVNMDQVVVVEPGPTGTHIRTTLVNEAGKPIILTVTEEPEVVWGMARAARSN